ncbi:MAG: hypothetical protein WCA09_17275 [Burkholderiales bacterium]
MTNRLILRISVSVLMLIACSAPNDVSGGFSRPYQERQTAPLDLNRTDVPWQAARTVDPDNVRSL